uniref:Uncharacterized protein n=1 Tax=Setaria viridis TaxID=4556 RepID=A0A4V6DBE3_SETVI|nr:hypothetical protein SEVIR_2G262400v2 [Setaria viridis]
MDPRRGCWECSSSEDVSRPLLPVHDDDDRPAGSRSCSALRSALGNKYLAVASGPAACPLICALGNSAGTRRRATCSACWPGCSSGGSRTPCRSPSRPWRRCSCSRRSASRPPTTSPRHTWTTSSPSSSAASSSRSPSSTTASTDAPPSTSRPCSAATR